MSLSPQFGSIVPSPIQTPSPSNYLVFDGAAGGNFAQQYLPEIYEQEVERYGNRTLSGFLRMVGAEMPMTSDQVIWSEQNRLHISYDNCSVAAGGGAGAALASVVTIPVGAGITNVISINDTVVLLDPANGAEAKGIVTNRAAGNVTVMPFANATFDAQGISIASATIKMFVYGSDYTKGSSIGAGVGNSAARVSIDPSFTQFSNSPVIIRDQYVVTGSDMAQIGWVEVATEDGQSGYLWYLKAESETRLRFEDYLEMAMVEGELNANANGAAGQYATAVLPGTQGLFAAIRDRGNVEVGFTAANGLDEFDAILKNLDTQGAIEENMLFLQRQTALDFDDMVAAMNGNFASSASASYGLFDNESEMALNFGFTGFRRGSYDFYKTDWKYLNDASTRGLTNNIDGVLIPAGTTTVYDQMLGSNIRRPFLHVRYRASETEDRRYKNWITGSVGGAYTDGVDAMSVHFLTERCLVVQAANNFVLFKTV